MATSMMFVIGSSSSYSRGSERRQGSNVGRGQTELAGNVV